MRRSIKDGVLECDFARDIFVQDEGEYWEHGENGRVAEQQYSVVDREGDEEELDREYRLHYCDYESAVDDELREEGTTLIR